MTKEKGQGKKKGNPIQIRAGDKVGHLTVLGVEDTEAICRCSCGAEVKISVKDLKNGRKKTCGCGTRSDNKIHVGSVIREVKVIRPAEPKVFRTGIKKQWVVECVYCHFQRIMRETDLVCGKVSICPQCKNKRIGESV